MPAVQITKTSQSQYSLYVEATCGKVTAFVGIPLPGRSSLGVTVCQTSNASHRAWRGMGRTYMDKQAALDHFRSAEMKAIIEAAFVAFDEQAAA